MPLLFRRVSLVSVITVVLSNILSTIYQWDPFCPWASYSAILIMQLSMPYSSIWQTYCGRKVFSSCPTNRETLSTDLYSLKYQHGRYQDTVRTPNEEYYECRTLVSWTTELLLHAKTFSTVSTLLMQSSPWKWTPPRSILKYHWTAFQCYMQKVDLRKESTCFWWEEQSLLHLPSSIELERVIPIS